MICRRSFLTLPAPTLWAAGPGSGLGLGLGLGIHPQKSLAAAATAPSLHHDVQARLKAIERRSGARLGVCIVDTGNGAEFSHRADERFLMCSTFKLMASAFVLRRVDLGQETLERVLPYSAADLVAHSPVTAQHVAQGGMTMGALCEATVTTSDNAAANLILASYGGPAGLTAYLRSEGDSVTRLDRYEPHLNAWKAGDVRDTTSPRAMLRSMQRATLGDALLPASRQRLQAWMLANTTGDTRLRAGIPTGWRVGDKTGKGDAGTTNDIGVVWPPGRAPLLVTAYLTEGKARFEQLDRAIAQVGEVVAFIGSR